MGRKKGVKNAKITLQNERTICKKYKAGFSQKSLRIAYRTSDHKIRKILKKHNVRIRHRGSFIKLKDSKIKKIVALYTKDVSITEILKRAKCSRASIYRYIRENNVKQRNPHQGEIK